MESTFLEDEESTETEFKVCSGQRRSRELGWDRAFDKYSPSKEASTSPIIASQANLKHVIRKLSDQYVDLYTWVVNMSEQYFYDNTFLLLGFAKKDQTKMVSILKRSFNGVDIDFFNKLEKIILLGKGAFGSVYSCIDPKTKLQYAIKKISAKYKSDLDHFENLLEYMGERNSMIQATGSPFVVKILYSLQFKKSRNLFLFCECCIGDLRAYIENTILQDHKPISKMLFENQTKIIQKLHEEISALLEVNYIYIFEMLCGLDFLVKCNIIHQDIKPDNIMISNNLHLKIGDFGLAYRTRTIHRETNKMLVKATKLDTMKDINNELFVPGTAEYQDIELQLMRLEELDYEEFTRIFAHLDKYNTPGLSYKPEVLEPNYLVDTWAIGVCAIELLFRGFNLFNPDSITGKIFIDIPRKFPLFLIHLIARIGIYNKYIKNGLNNAGGESLGELMLFLASIFKPRLTRCESFTNEKEIYQLTKKIKMRFIDMDKVEKITTFSSRHFLRSNIHFREIPKNVGNIFHKKKYQIFDTFKDMLEDSKDSRPGEILQFQPGVNINFFN